MRQTYEIDFSVKEPPPYAQFKWFFADWNKCYWKLESFCSLSHGLYVRNKIVDWLLVIQCFMLTQSSVGLYSLQNLSDDCWKYETLSYREPVSFLVSHLYRSIPSYIEHYDADVIAMEVVYKLKTILLWIAQVVSYLFDTWISKSRKLVSKYPNFQGTEYIWNM